MNQTQASPDLVSRCVPIRFYFEGNPGEREFGDRDPLSYAKQHRTELLGELAGMVVCWNQRGRPTGARRHRLSHWANVVGGVLLINGLPEFLENLDTSAAEFNTDLDELAALAERVVGSHASAAFLDTPSPGTLMKSSEKTATNGLSATGWEPIFRKVGIEVDRLDAAKSKRGRTTIVGNWLARLTDREVAITVGDRSGNATLKIRQGRSRKKYYLFEIRWEQVNDATTPAVDEKTTGKKCKTTVGKSHGGIRQSPKKTLPAQPTKKGAKIAAKKNAPREKEACPQNVRQRPRGLWAEIKLQATQNPGETLQGW